jgi:creatinase
MEFVDIAAPSMKLRMIKSAEEIAHITHMTRIADLGGAACVEATKVGVPEHEIALHSTAVMVKEIARTWPHGELMDTWTWFQSGINTDGAHNPVTSRKLERGDILSLNCFPMVAGYYVALERTLFCETATPENIRLWEINCKVHDIGKELLVPGAKCSDIAKQLNGIYESHQLLRYRSFGYGHSFGVLCHYYGREAGLELREDCDTILEPGMVVSMEPMITIPNHLPGAGGYREHDILVITENGNQNITGHPYGPAHMII